MTAYHVILGERKIDTVYYVKNVDPTYVKESLIKHDHYPDFITVEKET